MCKGLDIFAFDTCMIEVLCCEFHYNIYLCITPPSPPQKNLYTFIEAIIESVLYLCNSLKNKYIASCHMTYICCAVNVCVPFMLI